MAHARTVVVEYGAAPMAQWCWSCRAPPVGHRHNVFCSCASTCAVFGHRTLLPNKIYMTRVTPCDIYIKFSFIKRFTYLCEND